MGIFYASIGGGSPAGGDWAPASALVDTGAGGAIMPSALLAGVGIAARRSMQFRLAAGRA